MQLLFQIFQNLKTQPPKDGDGYNVAALPSIKNHKIGVTEIGQPMFFIKCDESKTVKSIDSNLEFISVQFNRNCHLLKAKNKKEEGIYTIISLKSDSTDFQEYFMGVVYLVIKRLPEKPQLIELKIEVEKLINLFSKFSKPPLKTIQGLWAEILVIEQSNTPEYLIQSWHSSVTDKFDFNDGSDKIEVKSTSKSRRIHNFSIEQLNPNKNSNLIIASVFTVETGLGKNIFDLIELIMNKIKDKNVIFRINEVVAQTLGKDFEKAFEVYFDYQLAIDSVRYYKSNIIPKINMDDVPKQVISVRFDSDLTDIPNIVKCKKNSILQNSLFQK